jgi:hypothetical protein
MMMRGQQNYWQEEKAWETMTRQEEEEEGDR